MQDTRQPDANDLGDLLQELRILLQGAQILTAFLIVLPFNQGFSKIQLSGKWDYIAAFACSMSSLVLLSAPAAQHRMEWPLTNRMAFKRFASRLTLIGLVPLSVALVAVTHLIVTEVVGKGPAMALTALVGLLIGVFWWLLPWIAKRRAQ
jgi:hypothetical protein